MRRELGDIESLAADIQQIGLLHPIVVTKDKKLIAGRRRMAAFKHLGRKMIEATVVDIDLLQRGELSENAQRLDLQPTADAAKLQGETQSIVVSATTSCSAWEGVRSV